MAQPIFVEVLMAISPCMHKQLACGPIAIDGHSCTPLPPHLPRADAHPGSPPVRPEATHKQEGSGFDMQQWEQDFIKARMSTCGQARSPNEGTCSAAVQEPQPVAPAGEGQAVGR